MPPYLDDSALISLLEAAQRVIAMARLGRKPSRDAARQTLDTIEQAENQLKRYSGSGVFDLSAARAAAAVLALDHLPNEAACIGAVRVLGCGARQGSCRLSHATLC
jgi:hypothetical protein